MTRSATTVALAIAGAAIVTAAAIPAAAQQPARQGSVLTCPPTLQAEYRRVSAFEPDEAKGKIDGFTPVFQTTTIRLMQANIGFGVAGKEIDSQQPDSGRAGRLTWGGLDKGPRQAGEGHHVKCEYEGGGYLEHALPASTKSCTLDLAETKPTAATTRTFLTRAVFTCR